MVDLLAAAYAVKQARARAEAAEAALTTVKDSVAEALVESTAASEALMDAEAALLAACDEAPPVQSIPEKIATSEALGG